MAWLIETADSVMQAMTKQTISTRLHSYLLPFPRNTLAESNCGFYKT